MDQNIKKRSGQEENYQSEKILNSMMNAGVSRDIAGKVARGIAFHEGITTLEVRNQVIGGIKNKEPQAAKKYEAYPKKVH